MNNKLTNNISLLIILLFTYTQSDCMKRTLNKSSTSRYFSSLSKTPRSSLTKQPFTCPRIFSSKSNALFNKTSSYRRKFSTTQPQLGFWENIKYQFLSSEEKQNKLFDDLKTTIYKDMNFNAPNEKVKQVIKNFEHDEFINKKHPDLDWLTPLRSAIIESKDKSIKYQISLLELLKSHNANLHDPKALTQAVRRENIGALIVLQPYFTIQELYYDFQPVREAIEKIEKLQMLGSPKIFMIYDILNQPTNPITIAITSQGMKDTNVKISTVEEYYNIINGSYKKYNFNTISSNQNKEKNYSKKSEETEKEVPTKYKNPDEQALYAFYTKIKKLSPEEIIGLSVKSPKNEIKAEYFKLIRKYHPDRFNNNPTLKKMAEEVTKNINKAYKEIQ